MVTIQETLWNRIATHIGGRGTAPTASMYNAAGVGGVTMQNLAWVNSAVVGMPLSGTAATDKAGVAAIAASATKLLGLADGALADNPAYTLIAADFSNLGVMVTASDLTLINSALGARTDSQVANRTVLQGIVDAMQAVMATIAGMPSGGLAAHDFQVLGIRGVSADNLGAVADALVTNGAGKTTVAELQAIVVDALIAPLSDVARIAIDGANSIGGQSGYYNAGDVITLSVTMKSAVDVMGAPRLVLDVGGQTVYANFDANLSGGSANLTTLKFKYTVASGQGDETGIGTGAHALGLNGGTIKLTGTSTDARIDNHPTLAENSSYRVDTTAPTVAIAAVATDGTVDAAERADGVAVGGSSTGAVGQGVTVAWGTVVRTATVQADGSWNVAFASATIPSDGNYSLTANVSDAAGNAAPQARRSVTVAAGAVDDVAPAFTSATTANVAENQATLYTAAATDAVEFTNGVVTYSLVAGGDAALLSIDGSTGVVSLANGTLDYDGKSSYGFTVQAQDASGNVSAQAVRVGVTNAAPKILSVAITHATGINGDTLDGGDVVTATVTFDETVTLAAPMVSYLRIYHSNDSREFKLSELEVLSNGINVARNPGVHVHAGDDFSSNLLDSLHFNPNALIDGAHPATWNGQRGNDSNLAWLSGVKPFVQIELATFVPLSQLTLFSAENNWEPKATWDYRVFASDRPLFSGRDAYAVLSSSSSVLCYDIGALTREGGASDASLSATVSGIQPKLELDIGGTLVQADYGGGNGTRELTFNYEIQGGLLDPDGIAIGANGLSLGGSSIADSSGLPVDVAYSAVAGNSDYKVGPTLYGVYDWKNSPYAYEPVYTDVVGAGLLYEDSNSGISTMPCIVGAAKAGVDVTLSWGTRSALTVQADADGYWRYELTQDDITSMGIGDEMVDIAFTADGIDYNMSRTFSINAQAQRTLRAADTGHGSDYVDALIIGDSGWEYATITYSFASAAQGSSSEWTETEKQSFRDASQLFANVCNVRFVEGDYYENKSYSTNIYLLKLTSSAWSGSAPTADFEYPIDQRSVGGFLRAEPVRGRFNEDAWSSPEAGTLSYAVTMHELGHGMGLSHPFDSTTKFPGVVDSYDLGTYDLNQGIWTLESYSLTWSEEGAQNGFGYSMTPMSFDVAALQEMYGANTSFKMGDDTYTIPTTLGAGTGWVCIWDAGGSDTISNEGSSSACQINLNAFPKTGGLDGKPYVSYAPGFPAGFTIADGAVIENAVGGKGDDTLTGNGVSNRLKGGAGADSFVFSCALGSGNVDTIEDFAMSEGDRIKLDDAVFVVLAGKSNISENFAYGIQAADADDFLLYDTRSGHLFYDVDGSGNLPAVLFASLSSAPGLTAAQFVIV